MNFSFKMDDYEGLKKNFKLEVPEYFNFGFDAIDHWAEDEKKLALFWVSSTGEQENKLTFRDISLASNRFANALRNLGVKKGDRVLIMLPRIPEWYSILVGCHKLGAVVMPAPVMLSTADVEYRLLKGKASVVVTNAANFTKVDEACNNLGNYSVKHKILIGSEQGSWSSYEKITSDSSDKLSPDDIEKTLSRDPFLIYFTSGTTKYPKMVQHVCSYPIGHLRTAALWHGATKDDIIWVVSDTGWAKSAWGLYGQWVLGTALFVHNAEGRFNPDLTLKLLTTKGITIFCGPPTVYRMLILEDLKKYDYSGLKRFTSAGEPLNPEVIRVWQEATKKVIQEGYGQTESTLLVGNYSFMSVKPGSMGKPVPDINIDILDEDLNSVHTGEVGYICLKSNPKRPAGIFEGYIEDPEENARVFHNGWYNTGDKAYKDEDGYYYFVGRGDDIIKASGYRIGPFEVESVVLEHPAVAENAVVASPDPVRGEIIKAFVVLAPGYKPSDDLIKDIQKFVKSRTAPYKYPREIEFMDELPKTVSGKIKRAVLRNREIQLKSGRPASENKTNNK
ncbi:MAG: AMP-binding protein [Nitrospiraceae bacterium]|nr:AMP-binding protein [Nitrospiraceae bacterium]